MGAWLVLSRVCQPGLPGHASCRRREDPAAGQCGGVTSSTAGARPSATGGNSEALDLAKGRKEGRERAGEGVGQAPPQQAGCRAREAQPGF